jgi:hypothetical protein
VFLENVEELGEVGIGIGLMGQTELGVDDVDEVVFGVGVDVVVEEGEVGEFVGVGLFLLEVGSVLLDEVVEVFLLAGEEEVGEGAEEGVSELIVFEILLIDELALLKSEGDSLTHGLNGIAS